MNRKLLAFTFDDAPSYSEMDDNPTTTIINAFKEIGGKGTFFVIGKHLENNGRKLIDEALKAGFEIENHTQTHANLYSLTKPQIEEEIMTVQNTVIKEFGIEMKYMRPAGLGVSPEVFEVCEKLHMPVIFGSHGKAGLNDWDPKVGSEFIKNTCLDNIYPGQIVLMHGHSQGTPKVIYEILEKLSNDGYEFVTLSELFDAYGVSDILPCNRPIVDAQLTNIE